MFKENNQATITYYKTKDYSYAATTVTLAWGTCTTGTNNGNKLILRQTRDDWVNYVDTETVEPTITGFMNDDYIFTFTWTATTLTCAKSIAIPCNSV